MWLKTLSIMSLVREDVENDIDGVYFWRPEEMQDA